MGEWLTEAAPGLAVALLYLLERGAADGAATMTPTPAPQDAPRLLELVRTLWPMALVLAALIWGTIELRVRAIIAAREEEWQKRHEELRRELNTPIAANGVRIMKTEDVAREQEARIVELEAKTGVFWRMIETATAGLLKRPE